MPKIQLALDVLSAERALEIAQAASPWVDILEAGTPLIKSVGIGIVSRLKVAPVSYTHLTLPTIYSV